MLRGGIQPTEELLGLVGTSPETASGEEVESEFAIRWAAVEKRIPCFTSLDTARTAVWAMASGDCHFNVLPMSRYLKGQR